LAALNQELQELQELQEFRSSGVQEFRSSGVQEFRSSGVIFGEALASQAPSWNSSAQKKRLSNSATPDS